MGQVIIVKSSNFFNSSTCFLNVLSDGVRAAHGTANKLSCLSFAQRGLLEKRTNYLETPLFRAVNRRKLSAVVQLLAAGASLDAFLPGDVSVFHRAAVLNLPDILKELLAASTHVPQLKDQRDTKMGMSALHHAASVGAVECIKVSDS